MDTTLNVKINFAAGDLAGQLKRSQQEIGRMTADQNQFNGLQRQQAQQAQRSIGPTAALVAAQVLGTRAAVRELRTEANLRGQITRGQQQQLQTARALGGEWRREVSPKTAASLSTVAAGQAGNSMAKRVSIARRQAEQTLIDQTDKDLETAKKNAYTLSTRANELNAGPKRKGRRLQDALEWSMVPALALAPHGERLGVAKAMIEARAERHLLGGKGEFAGVLDTAAIKPDKDKGTKGQAAKKLGDHADTLAKLAEDRLGLAADLARVDLRKLAIENMALNSAKAGQAAQAQVAAHTQSQVNEARKRVLIAEGTHDEDQKVLAAVNLQADHSERITASRQRLHSSRLAVPLSGLDGPRADSLTAASQDLESHGNEAIVRKRQAEMEASLVGSTPSTFAASQEVQAQGAEQTLSLKQQVTLAKEKSKFMASPEGRKAMREEVQLSKQLNQEGRGQAWKRLVSEQGVFGAGLTRLNEGLQQFGGQLQMAFAGGVAGISALIAAASPSHWATITESVKGLAIATGESFLGTADDISLALQRTTKWVRQLSPETRQAAANWAIYGLGVVGVGAAMIKLIGVAAGLQASLAAAGVTMGTFLTVAGGIGAVTLAVGALAAAWYVVGQNQGRTIKLSEESQRAQQLQAGTAARSEALGVMSPVVQKWLQEAKGDPAARKEILDRQFEGATKDADARRASLSADTSAVKAVMDRAEKMANERIPLAGPGGIPQARYGAKQVTEEIVKGFQDAGIMISEERANIVTNDLFYGKSVDAERVKALRDLPEVRLKLAEQKAAAAKMLMGGEEDEKEKIKRSLRGLPQPTFTQASQLSDKFIIAANKGTGDLDADNAKEQTRILSKILGALERGQTPNGPRAPLVGYSGAVVWP